MIRDENCFAKDLEYLIGKLVRVSMILLGSECFLKLLRNTLHLAKGGRMLFNEVIILDLKFWVKLIDGGIAGFSMSKIILRMITNKNFTDALGNGIGCHNMKTVGV